MQKVAFQCFQLMDLFLVCKLAPEWELDVVVQVQLASFPANWNLGNLALLVNSLTTVGYLLEVFIGLWIPSMVRIFTSAWS